MEADERNYVQRQWSKDEINIICATVAFGMGINKPDVRFVLHHSIPKSIEGYHQESGRAGRDNLPASCILYYNYGDYIRMKHMLTQSAADQNAMPAGGNHRGMEVDANAEAQRKTNLENLHRMLSYCVNEVDCRRSLQLSHFGEVFDASRCQKSCDNCSRMATFHEEDVSNTAKQLVQLVRDLGQCCSLTHVLDVFRGSLNQKIKMQKHDRLNLHGAGKNMARGRVERIMHHLVCEEILREDVSRSSEIYGGVSSVLKVVEVRANELIGGQRKVSMRFPTALKPDKPEKVPKADKAEVQPRKGRCNLQENHHVPQIRDDPELSGKLYAALHHLRRTLVEEAGGNLMPYHIMGNAELQQISKKVPRTIEELLEVNGMGKVKCNKYGARILEAVAQVVAQYNGSSTNQPVDVRFQPVASGPKRSREAPDVAGWRKTRKGEACSSNSEDEADTHFILDSWSAKKSKKSEESNLPNEGIHFPEEVDTGMDVMLSQRQETRAVSALSSATPTPDTTTIFRRFKYNKVAS